MYLWGFFRTNNVRVSISNLFVSCRVLPWFQPEDIGIWGQKFHQPYQTTTSACPIVFGSILSTQKESFQTPFWAQTAKRSLENSDVSPKHFLFCFDNFQFFAFSDKNFTKITFNLETFQNHPKIKKPSSYPKSRLKLQKTHQFKGAIWMFPKIVGFPPKSSILIGYSFLNHPFRGTPILGNTHLWHRGTWASFANCTATSGWFWANSTQALLTFAEASSLVAEAEAEAEAGSSSDHPWFQRLSDFLAVKFQGKILLIKHDDSANKTKNPRFLHSKPWLLVLNFNFCSLLENPSETCWPRFVSPKRIHWWMGFGVRWKTRVNHPKPLLLFWGCFFWKKPSATTNQKS